MREASPTTTPFAGLGFSEDSASPQQRMERLCATWLKHVRSVWGAQIRLVELPSSAVKIAQVRDLTKAGKAGAVAGEHHKVPGTTTYYYVLLRTTTYYYVLLRATTY